MYKVQQKTNCRGRECWDILRNAAKGKSHSEVKTHAEKKRKKTFVPVPVQVANSENLAGGDESDRENIRPVGKKKAKMARADNQVKEFLQAVVW